MTDQVEINFSDAVRPLFTMGTNGNPRFQGTGFFIKYGDRILLISALHVSKKGDLFVLKPFHERVKTDDVFLPTNTVAKSEQTDLVVMECPSWSPKWAFELGETIYQNSQILTFEYSRFEFQVTERNGNQVIAKPKLNGSMRIGNVVRYISTDDRFPEGSLELSYPAIDGASGAPVIQTRPFSDKMGKIVGVVVANAKYGLLPIERHYHVEEESEAEHITYYLPAGVAVNVRHLKKLLENSLK